MLENYENKWRYVGNVNSAIYPNLPPGEYVFNVRASNNIGVWNNEGKSLAITILAPWWQTHWAYTLYIIFVVGILASIRKFEINRQRNIAAIKESNFRAEAAELQAKAAEVQAQLIQAENDRKSKELEEARELQISMLPKELPQFPGLEIAVYMKTATEVGGDYYDFSTKEDGSLNICLGDATGHGMKAGTLVSMIKSLFTANSIRLSITEFFNSSNVALKKMSLEKMMMAFGMLNIMEYRVQITNAGIPPFLIYRKADKKVEEVKINGLPLGAMIKSSYNVYSDDLSAGDTLLIFSDGMPELQNTNKEMYGYERMISTFKDIAEKSSSDIIEYLKTEISKWTNGNEPDDDVTFVVIKVK
jgi:serine phosphatase RsbU (regulator of sigma subunit)